LWWQKLVWRRQWRTGIFFATLFSYRLITPCCKTPGGTKIKRDVPQSAKGGKKGNLVQIKFKVGQERRQNLVTVAKGKGGGKSVVEIVKIVGAQFKPGLVAVKKLFADENVAKVGVVLFHLAPHQSSLFFVLNLAEKEAHSEFKVDLPVVGLAGFEVGKGHEGQVKFAAKFFVNGHVSQDNSAESHISNAVLAFNCAHKVKLPFLETKSRHDRKIRACEGKLRCAHKIGFVGADIVYKWRKSSCCVKIKIPV